MYRAVLEGVAGLEKPVQAYGADMEVLRMWASGLLAKSYKGHPTACVQCYRIVEEPEWVILPPVVTEGPQAV